MKYRYLKKDEIVQEGDEVDICRDGYRDEPLWVKTKCVGRKVPDPRFIAHSTYRRKII